MFMYICNYLFLFLILFAIFSFEYIPRRQIAGFKDMHIFFFLCALIIKVKYVYC